ncbi:MAG: hypothetical protein GTN36_06195 [Candidatus Aenigmarchaeota archaeon]|nr:hypothetical protein [Candidatus Aenigmarchaeota archaeon]
MKKALVLIVLALLLPSAVLADGMIMPRFQKKTFDFTSVKEKQQYAVIEVLSNYFEKMNIFLSLTSLDYETHDITVVIPLKSVPQDVSGDKLNSSEFLNKYGFDDVERLIEKQSVAGFIKKSSPQIRDALGEYIMLSLISPIYEISKFAFFPFYGGFMAGSTLTDGGLAAREQAYPGVTHIATYEFEGATIDIYDVESGNTLEEFMKDYYDLYLPDNVKDAVDNYKTHYIAVLNAMIGPPGDVGLLKEYAPNTFNDALKYVRANPEFTFTCYDYSYGYGVPRYDYRCSPEQAIREKFSDYITRAQQEAAGKSYSIDYVTILNPGFEEGTNFWRNYGYSRYGSTGSSGFYADSSDYYSGSQSLYVYDNDQNGWVGICQSFNVITGKRYVASTWAKAKEGQITFQLTTTTPGSGGGECFSVSSISSGGWAKYTVDCTPKYSSTLYLCFNTGSMYNTGSGWFDNVNMYGEGGIINVEKSVIDFFLSAYSNATNGMEISMTLPIRDGEIFYPLGTGIAWATPIEDTRILVEMDRSLDAGFLNVQNSVIDDNNRYFLWNFKNWNPDFDIKGTVAPSSFVTSIGDTGKLVLESMNENSVILSVIFMIIIVIAAGFIVRLKGRGDLKRKTFFMILAIIFAPLISIWAVALLAYGLKTKPKKGELRENMINVLIFLGILILAWILMAVTSIIMGV